MAISFLRLVREEKLRRQAVEAGDRGGGAAASGVATAPGDGNAPRAPARPRDEAAAAVTALFPPGSRPVAWDAARVLPPPAPEGCVALLADALSPAQEAALVAAADACPWTDVRGRRLQLHGADPQAGGAHSAAASAVLPDWLAAVARWAGSAFPGAGGFRPNHVLVNEYARGEGIMPHTDGPCYEDRVCILSCGGPCVMHFRTNVAPTEVGTAADRTLFSVVLRPRSALLFRGDAYTRLRHGIDAAAEDEVGRTARGEPSPCLNADGALPPPAAGREAGRRLVLPRAGRRISFTLRTSKEGGGASRD